MGLIIAAFLLATIPVGHVSALRYSVSDIYDHFSVVDGSMIQDLPKTEREAVKHDWIKMNDCGDRPAWEGKRYVKFPDFSVVLLFDKWGVIAGMQMGLSEHQSHGFPSKAMQRYFVREGGYYYSTVYFLTPEAICTTGRIGNIRNTVYDFELQNGPTPKHLEYLPGRVPENTDWSVTTCITTKGSYLFNNLTTNTDCSDYFPFFVLLDPDLLIGFGWFLFTRREANFALHSASYSHQMNLPFVPECYHTVQQMTTLHVYLRNISEIHC